MPRQLHYVAGVRLLADPYDRWLWHFAIRSRRYRLRSSAGTYVLHAADGAHLGAFNTMERAIARAREHVQMADTDRIPTISPYAARSSMR